MRVAVIGTGIAGNAAAWALSKRYPVTVYDRELRPGGHSHTVTIDYDGTPLAVDIGFIVYNELNYPDLTALFAHLGVETIESCMSFAVTADAGRFEWKGGGNTWRDTAEGPVRPAAQPVVAVLSVDAARHPDASTRKASRTTQPANSPASRSANISRSATSRRGLLTDYLAPMGAAIWSAPSDQMLDFPAENFVAFFSNHRLLQYDRPVWRTVKGGSRSYVEKLTAAFRDRLRLGCAVTSIERTPHGVVVNDSHGGRETLRSRRDRVAQRPGAGDAVRRRATRTRRPRRHRLRPQRGLPASRHQADAEAPARLGVVEFPALAARGRRRSTTSP